MYDSLETWSLICGIVEGKLFVLIMRRSHTLLG